MFNNLLGVVYQGTFQNKNKVLSLFNVWRRQSPLKTEYPQNRVKKMTEHPKIAPGAHILFSQKANAMRLRVFYEEKPG